MWGILSAVAIVCCLSLLVAACLLCSYSSLTLGLEQMWEEAKPGTEDIRWWIWAEDADTEKDSANHV